ncbi:MAG: TIGR03905 family TSCPD domain-containing protein [Solirubrobacterales bacterium]
MYTYLPKGVCTTKVDFEVKDNKIFNVNFKGGCSGNLLGIGRLIDGMDINDAHARLNGIKCGYKNTSCPDQLAKAIYELVIAKP